MSLSRYAVEIKGISNEILYYLSDDWEWAAKGLRVCGDDWFMRPDEVAMKKAHTFLGKTPSLQHKQLVKMEGRERLQIIIVSAAMAQMAGDLLNVAQRLEYTVGKGYRSAAKDVASVALRGPKTYEETVRSIMQDIRNKGGDFTNIDVREHRPE